MSAKRKVKAVDGPIKLDLGCGKNPREGFTGVDSRDFGQPLTVNLVKRKKGVEAWRVEGAPDSDGYDIFEKWPWEDASVDQVHCSHFIEHLTRKERVFFVNELYRILKPGVYENGQPVSGCARLIAPHFASCRAYGDLSHDPHPICEMWFQYVDKAWRESQAPHNDFYKCDFHALWAYSSHPALTGRTQDYVSYAWQFYKEAIQDVDVTFVKK